MTPFAGATATAGDLERDAVDHGMDVTRVKIEAPIEQSGEPGAPMPVYCEHLA